MNNYPYNKMHIFHREIDENWDLKCDDLMNYDWYMSNNYKYIEFVKKIEEWWLECKYNPKYKYCREKTVMKDYNELYNN